MFSLFVLQMVTIIQLPAAISQQPDPPTFVALTADDITTTSLHLSWTVSDNSTVESHLLTYIVQGSTDAPAQIPVTDTEYTLTGLLPAQTYVITLISQNDGVDSDPATLTTNTGE